MISPQLEKYSKQVVKKHTLTFEVLCDKGNKIASNFGLLYKLPIELQELYGKFGIELDRYNGDNSWSLPIPGRFIINQQGIIIDAEVNPDYTVRPEPKSIIEFLKNS